MILDLIGRIFRHCVPKDLINHNFAGRLITKVDLSGMPKTTAVSHLIDIMSGLDRCFEVGCCIKQKLLRLLTLCIQINKAPNEFFFAKIHVLLQLFKSSENDKCYLIDLEEG